MSNASSQYLRRQLLHLTLAVVESRLDLLPDAHGHNTEQQLPTTVILNLEKERVAHTGASVRIMQSHPTPRQDWFLTPSEPWRLQQVKTTSH